MKKGQVNILLSTYNGEEYLENLLNSLLQQDYKDFIISIRDDGSVDSTYQILEKFSSYSNVRIIYGKNMGPTNSFFELLKESGGSEYYAFCDQDDYWHETKISRAIDKLLERGEKPLLYGSGLTVVDENLNFIRETRNDKFRPSFENALVENVIPGCTLVINSEARNLIIKELPSDLRMHDWWMYQVVSGVGEVVYDYESRILYRQHGKNTVGSDFNLLDKWKRRISQLKKVNNRLKYIMIHADYLYEIHYDDMNVNSQKELLAFINTKKGFSQKIKYIFIGKTYRMNFLDNIIFKTLFLIRKI
ncbi:glycosyltransferase family 2 protein [Enterococcus eurekensis]|uniref:Glycosyltransferase family 2 protein n=1 Tax=Enterococcus eurekensis TaxID=1159753 RepID=A0ABV9M2X3_9ENTE